MPETTRNRILKSHAQNLRKNMTLEEQRLWYFLRNRQLNGIKFRRQQIIGHYIADFVSMEHKLIIELDGGQHAEQIAYDNQRTEFLNEQDYRVIRFWNNEVLQNTEAVLNEILKACGGLPPP